MPRTILAILAGVVTTGLTAAVCGLFGMPYRVQDALSWVVPQGWRNPAFVAARYSTVGLLTGVPGIVVAVLIARRRLYPRGHCRACGYDQQGKVSGRCPECGVAV